MSAIATRAVPTRARLMLEQQAVDPLLARLFAARGVIDVSELHADLKHLLPPTSLTHADTELSDNVTQPVAASP